ncbi:meiosis-specific serine/threonine-protein kinase mek1-like [Xenia sp. Carnegie-2017]|uniref:meiosis-specific serine/threonine-protein kinase mek1-like n=1 Tax=Xenia sp. Carnegie-2017 TaxID=2897299 RepID=UPI001F04A830|nr:meiosis-specific serine/threonine-protein kinase mek1-like [Xenia sp. Carnegie-2017]
METHIMEDLDLKRIKTELKFQKLKYLWTLGKGSYGLVVAVESDSDKNKYAVKINSFANEKAKTFGERELATLINVKSENVVKFFDSWTNSNHSFLYFKLELCYKDLRRFVYEKNFGGGATIVKNPELYRHCFPQILKGLQALHEKDIVHRDLHFANILIAFPPPKSVPEIKIKITDFGLARYINKNSGNTTLSRDIGHKLFRAPEIDSNSSFLHYDERVDMYSAGLLLYFLSRFLPKLDDWFAELDDIRTARKCIDRQDLAHTDDNLLWKTITNLLKRNPNDRPFARDTLCDWNQDINKIYGNLVSPKFTTKKTQNFMSIICYLKQEDETSEKRCELSKNDNFSNVKHKIMSKLSISSQTNVILKQEITIDGKQKKLITISDDNDVEVMFRSAGQCDRQRLQFIVKVVSGNSTDEEPMDISDTS